ncbi:MAG TPA: DNA recombination protein RmuC [Rhizomicrobium sp.]
MAFVLAFAAAAFSMIAAIFAVLAFLRAGRTAEPAAGAGMAETIRTEADRTRLAADEQARGTRQELAEAMRRLQDSMTLQLDSGIEKIQAPITGIGKKLDDEMARMAEEAGRNRDALRLSLEGKLEASNQQSQDAARALREELTGNFDKSSRLLSETMKNFGDSQHQRLGEVKLQITGMSEKQAAAGEALRATVEGRLDKLREENSTKLDEMRQTVDEKLQSTLERRLTESFQVVQNQLDNVHKGLGEMQTLATGVGDLKRVLTNVKTRGTWGEVQLGMLLEQFLLPDQYLKNAQVKEGSLERVEFAVRFPGRHDEKEVLLPIDAKFPQEDYERLVHAAERADAIAVEVAAAALEARVKSFAKTVSDKYINPPMTTDFAILFLPTESLFAEVLRRPGLFEQLQRDCRVTLAGPTTLSAMLSAFQLGFRSLAIQKRSSEVWQILGAVKTEFAQHGRVVDTLKKQLNAATNTIDRLGTRTRAMSRSLRNVETLPGAEADALLQLPTEAEPDDAEEAVE